MPVLVDTTIRLLGQEPLAGRMPTAELLRLAEILDGAGFAYLEVSGGGVFDAAVRRGVESPWERIRALNARTKTPLAMALRGRFLVGSRPVGGDFVRRFVASAAESGIDVFRLHDPLNDVENLREAAEAITDAGKEFDAGLVYSSGYTGETDALVEQAKKLPELGASRVLLHDPSGSLQPQRAQELVGRARPRRAACRSASTARAPRATRSPPALEAARAGADLIACAVYPVALTLHRVSGEALATALAGLGLDHWRRRRGALAGLRSRRRAHRRRARDAARAAHRRSRGRAPAAGRARRRARQPAARARRPGTGSTRCSTSSLAIRDEVGWPPLAAPIGQILGSQALLHVLSAARYQTVVDELRGLARRPLREPAGADRPGGQARGRARLRAAPPRRSRPAELDAAARPRRRGSPRARRSCCCSRSSATRPSRCCSRSAAGPSATRASPRAASTRHAPSGSARSCASSRSRASAR